MNENLIKYYVENNRLDLLISLFEHQRDNMVRAESLNRSYLSEIARLKKLSDTQPPSTQPPQELTTFSLAKTKTETKKTKPSPLDLI